MPRFDGIWETPEGYGMDGNDQKVVARHDAGQGFSASGTATAVLSTGDLRQHGIPLSNLSFVKSASSETVTITVAVGAGILLFNISGLTSETVAVNAADPAGNTLATVKVEQANGTRLAAATLGNGQFMLVLH